MHLSILFYLTSIFFSKRLKSIHKWSMIGPNQCMIQFVFNVVFQNSLTLQVIRLLTNSFFRCNTFLFFKRSCPIYQFQIIRKQILVNYLSISNICLTISDTSFRQLLRVFSKVLYLLLSILLVCHPPLLVQNQILSVHIYFFIVQILGWFLIY